MTYPVITVSELNGYIKTMFDSELMMRSLYVAGEISNLSVHARTGHMYFSLKDENASLKAVMFSSDASSLGFVPENGMKVTALGRVSVFERDAFISCMLSACSPTARARLPSHSSSLRKSLNARDFLTLPEKSLFPDTQKE